MADGFRPGARPTDVGLWQTCGVVTRGCTGAADELGLVLPKEAMDVKKLLALAAVAGGVLFVIRRNKSAKAQDDLWREATAPAAGAKKA